MGAVGGSLCDENMCGEAGRAGCMRSRVKGESVGAGGEGVGVLGRCVCFRWRVG